MRLMPAGDRLVVLLDPVESEKYGDGKIILPDNHSVPSRRGEVIGAGPDVRLYRVGQRVAVGYFSGVVVEMPRFKIMGDTLRVLRESEILFGVDNEGVLELER
jgi:co-chaperonin GroES (HSP10)